MCDETGPNCTGIGTVYDEKFVTERVISYQWHFMNEVHKVQDRINKIGEQFQQEFLELCTNMCRVKTVAEYGLVLARLVEIVNMIPEAGNFLEWYDVRRFHLFPAFREGLHSGINLAESGNAKWKPNTKLSLVAAAKDDVTTMIEQECEYKRFNEGESIPIGRGPTDIQRATQEKRMQMEQGRDIGEMFANQAAMDMQSASEKYPDYFIPNKATKHKPGKGTKTTEDKKKHKDTPVQP